MVLLVLALFTSALFLCGSLVGYVVDDPRIAGGFGALVAYVVLALVQYMFLKNEV